MADLVALHAALIRIGFTDEAATAVTEDQAINSLDELRLLTDEEVENLCAVIRKPGGIIENPNAGAGQPPTIPDPGIPVALRAANNLKLACYFLRHKQRTSRIVMAAEITVSNIQKLRELKLWEDGHEEPDAPELTFKDWPRTIETIEEYLCDCLGATKIPLAYVVRKDEAIPVADPPNGYATLQDELIARSVIKLDDGTYSSTYLEDRIKVYNKIAELTRDHECWTYVRPAQRQRDGRMAFQGLEGHYLGVNNVDNMSASAENKLKSTTYTGETKRWNFEKYVRVHKDQHSVLDNLVQHGYAGVDERSKVRHLLAGIKTKDLDPVKTQIMASVELRINFDRCVNLFQDFISQSTSNDVRTRHVASVNKSSLKRNDSDDIDMSVEDRYYKKNEYAQLTPSQRKGLSKKRKARNHSRYEAGPAKKPRMDSNSNDQATAKTVKVVTRLVKQVQSIKHPESVATSDLDEMIAEKEPLTNRNNKALTRKHTV